jgi:hypothetical protein
VFVEAAQGNEAPTFNARAETVATKLMSLAAAGGCVTGCVPLRLRA